MARFNQVNLEGAENRRDDWQKHHVVLTQQFGNDDFREFFNRISGLDPNFDVSADIRYDHNLFDFNGFLLPEQASESLAFGFAVHNGSYEAFSRLVTRILRRVRDDLNSGDLTTEQAARSDAPERRVSEDSQGCGGSRWRLKPNKCWKLYCAMALFRPSASRPPKPAELLGLRRVTRKAELSLV